MAKNRSKRIREIWKAIPGYDGYEVSNLGRVRSVDRYVHWNGTLQPRRGRLLRLSDGRDGMLYVDLSRKWRRAGVHQLVMLAFKGEPINGLEICHNDGNPKHNMLTNLRYGTRRDNQMDRVVHGTSNRGCRNGMSKLTEADVRDIKRGKNAIALARKYKIDRCYIYRIWRGDSWGWLR